MANTTDIKKYKESIKHHVDNDSFVFLYDDIKPIGVSRELLEKRFFLKDGSYYSYEKLFNKLAYSNKLTNILYKTTKGEWINFSRLCMFYIDSTDLMTVANRESNNASYKISVSKIPELYFTDAEGKVYYIEEADGKVNNYKRAIPIDEKNPLMLKIEQYSIDTPNLPVEGQFHRKNDLKITFLQENDKAENLLVWLNGVFVEPIYDTNNEKIFYIRDAKTGMITKPLTISDNDYFDYSNIDVVKSREPEFKYYYNIDLRIWRWEDVEVSKKWINVKHTKSERIVNNYVGYDVATELFFEEELNPDACLIFLNGQVLHKDEYTIDEYNKKHVYLNHIYAETTILLHELLEKGYDNPHAFFTNIILNRNFSAVNFRDSNGTKTLYIKHTRSMKNDFPMINDVMFRNPKLFDIVLVDGFFTPYTILRNGIYRFPRNVSTYITNEINMENSRIWKLEFVNN